MTRRRPTWWLLVGFGAALLIPHIRERSTLPALSPDDAGAVWVQANLRNASATVHLPCDVSRRMPKMDLASPLVDAIPRYTTAITVQSLAKCASPGSSGIETFLRYAFPLSDVYHEILPGSFPPMNASEANPDSVIGRRVELVRFAQSRGGHCNGIRGRVGKWVYNETYAEDSWYVPALGAPKGWIRNREMDGPYNHTSWKWEDDAPDCPIEELTLGGFCEAMHKLDMTRLFVLGDSIEFMRLVSFMHLMGLQSSVHTHLHSSMRWSYTIDCPSVGRFSEVDIVFYRTNHLMPVLGNETHPAEWHYHKQEHELFVCYGVANPPNGLRPNEKGWCPWVQEYLHSAERTMLSE
ncbi:hypothetical protein ACHAXT_000887 [Thalassiosira profunda]